MPRPPNLRGIRALVVDDNPTSQEIFKKMLESFSFRVILTASGEEGVAAIEKSLDGPPFDIVIMDWKLPGMDGIEAAKRIRNNAQLTRIPPVILVSAFGREDIRWRAEAAGVAGFLIKPIRSSVMFDTIINALAKDVDKEIRPADAQVGVPDTRLHVNGARVLLVEDNEINQQVAMEILGDAGVVVTLARNGREAVEAVKMKPYDAVLMDVQMPVMDGYTATETIRRDSRFKNLPIIAMTAHAMAGDYEKSILAGMNDHITKPIDPDRLYAVLAQWILTAPPPEEKSAPPPAPPTGETAAIAAAASTASAGVSKEPQFPTFLDGFDLSEGLRRLRGNKTLYRRLISDFAANYPNKTKEIRKSLDTGDYAEAHKMVHDIKGLAGNLAATQLQTAAAELDSLVKEADIQHPPVPGAVTKAFAAFEAGMDRALRSAQSMSAPADADKPLPETDLPPELVAEAASRLREAAEMGDVAGLKAIAEELSARETEFVPFQEKIAQLADNFDFDGILELANHFEKTRE